MNLNIVGLGEFEITNIDRYTSALLIARGVRSNAKFLGAYDSKNGNWIYIPITDKNLQLFLSGNLSIRDAVKEMDMIYRVYLGACNHSKLLLVKTLDLNMFPNDHYDFGDITFDSFAELH